MPRKTSPKKRNRLPTDERLPIDQPVAVYYRQSSMGQVGNRSTEMQRIDLAEDLIRRGWTEEKIILIDSDEGLSGAKRIDERPGMIQLMALIDERMIGAVAVADEDRLFRDTTQIQVNLFIEACKQARVMVITPTVVYAFHDPQVGSFYMRQFRFKAEMSADFLQGFVVQRLAGARKHMARQGLWSGHPMPIGFVVKDENRYEVWPELAEIISQWFNLFLELNGELRETVRQIRARGLAIPDFREMKAPGKYKYSPQIRFRDGGYTPTSHGLRSTLTHPAYAGIWVHEDGVVYDNHPAIIEIGTFWAVYNYLEKVDLRGNPNPSYRGRTDRYVHREPKIERQTDRPLLAGKLWTEWEGREYRVGLHYDTKDHHYQIVFRPDNGLELNWNRHAHTVDEIVVYHIREMLRETFDPQNWDRAIEQAFDSRDRTAYLRRELSQIESSLHNLEVSLETLSNAALISSAENRYEALQAEKDRVIQALNRTQNDTATREALEKLQSVYADDLWETASYEARKRIVHLLVDRVWVQPEGEMTSITIAWFDGGMLQRSVPKRGATDVWSYEEDETLRRLIESGPTQVDLCEVLPNRTWLAIQRRIDRLYDDMPLIWGPFLIRKTETYEEYVSEAYTCPRSVKHHRIWGRYERLILDRFREDHGLLVRALANRTLRAIQKEVPEAKADLNPDESWMMVANGYDPLNPKFVDRLCAMRKPDVWCPLKLCQHLKTKTLW